MMRSAREAAALGGLAAALLAAVAVGTAFGGSADRFVAVAQKIVKACNERDVAAFRADFNKQMADALPPDRAQEVIAGLHTQFGRITDLGAPEPDPNGGQVFLTRFERGELDMRLYLDGDGRIAGLRFTPAEPRVAVRERNGTPLILPCGGEWLIFWGGDTAEQNQHHGTPNQRYAFDLLMADDSGSTHKGPGQANEEYYAFGQDVLAPAAGKVTDVINGVRDNRPGSMNPYSALGNAVVIQHSDDEVSVLAHLKEKSIRVVVGEHVEAGQVIGLCGNSGNSSEPHIHYHLQQTPIIQDGRGIKCFFLRLKVTRDGKADVRTDYSPVKGDRVANAER